MKRYGYRVALILLISGVTWAQDVPPSAPPTPRPSMQSRRILMNPLPGPGGRWWSNPEMAQKLGVTADQQKKMDDIFQQYRLRLIDLNASLQKQELLMEPMLKADQPDETTVLTQIDKVAQARAELEKSDARMLLAIRRVLTADQWEKLQAEGGGTRKFPTAPARR